MIALNKISGDRYHLCFDFPDSFHPITLTKQEAITLSNLLIKTLKE